jgi:hypothetical protein
LVAAPLGQTLDIAEKVSSGMQTLFGGGAGDVSLAFHKQFTSAGGGGGNELRPGYIALIRAKTNEIDASKLSVKGSKLLYPWRNKGPEPLEGYDYMLLRIEGRSERDNWRLPNIEEPLNQAIKWTLEGDEAKASQYRTAALAVIWQSPDLAVADRRRVADAIKAELADIADQTRNVVAVERRSLKDIVLSRSTLAEARKRGPLDFFEVINP